MLWILHTPRLYMTARHNRAILTQCETVYITKYGWLSLWHNKYSFGLLTRWSRVRIQQGLLCLLIAKNVQKLIIPPNLNVYLSFSSRMDAFMEYRSLGLCAKLLKRSWQVKYLNRSKGQENVR